MTPQQTDLLRRVREHLPPDAATREVSMFGGRSVMVEEKMIVSVLKSGALLVRVAADDHEALLRAPGAHQAVMGVERSMGPGWIEVDAATLTEEQTLRFWVETALVHNRTITTASRQKN